MRSLIFTVAGGFAGYLWYRTVGCQSGACPLSSNVFMSVFWGAIGGFMLVAP